MRLKKYIIIYALVFLSLDMAKGNDFFNSQWILLSVGRTNNAFNHNSENDNGIGVFYNASISSSIFQQFYITICTSKVKEFQAPAYDVYKPLEYFTQKAVLFGRYFVIRDICIFPAIGYSWMEGINRGKWLGVQDKESYSCVSLLYKSNGIPWALQLNTNANGWVGVGLQLSGTMNSEKDFWGISLLVKIGKQY